VIENAFSAGFYRVAHRAPSAPGRVQRSGDQIEAFEYGLLGREVAAGLDRPPVRA